MIIKAKNVIQQVGDKVYRRLVESSVKKGRAGQVKVVVKEGIRY
ncbi:hypothetical protein [Staphylococcus sp. VBM19]